MSKFVLRGSGLEGELPDFLAHLTEVNPKMAAVLAEHFATLLEGTSDDARHAVRAKVNAAVRTRLDEEIARLNGGEA